MAQKVGGVEFDVDVGVDGAISASKKIVQSNERVEDSFQDIDAASKRASDSMTKGASSASKATSNLSRNVGMGAVQFGQLAGQIQGGQSALLAFSQQGADIGMLFGPAGMVVGGILSVASAIAGSFIPGLLEGGDATEELAEKLRELNKETKLTAAQQAALNQIQKEEAEATKLTVAEIEEKIETNKEVIASNERRIKSLSKLQGAQKMAAQSDIRGLREENAEREKNLTLLRAEAEIEQGVTGGAKTDPKKQQEAMSAFSERLEFIKSALNTEGDILAAANKRIFETQKEGNNAQLALLEEKVAAEKARRKFANEQELIDLQSQQEKIVENELLSQEQKDALLAEYREAEKQAKRQHENEITNIEREASEKRRKIQQKESMDRLKAVGGMFGNLSALMNTESRKLFEIGKAAAIAGAIVDGIAAAIGSFKVGAKIGGPVVGAAFAAASAAATFAQIQQIKATQFGAAGGGQSIQGGQVVNNQAQQSPQQPDRNISIALTGSNFSGGDVRALIGQINEELGDGATLSTTGG